MTRKGRAVYRRESRELRWTQAGRRRDRSHRSIDRSIRLKFRYGLETFAGGEEGGGGVAPRFRHEGKGIKMKKKRKKREN